MGRRAKAELLGLVDRIFSLYNSEHLTIEAIAGRLQDEGYDISREAIRRTVKSSKEVAQEFQESIAESRALIEAVRNNPNTDIIEATTALMSRRLFDFMKSVEELDFKDSGELANAIRSIAQSQTQIARLRLTFSQGFDAAKKAVQEALKAELKNHPDILDRINEVVLGIEAAE